MKAIARSLREQQVWLPVMACLAVACWLYLPDVLFHGPAGLHFIRQTDSLSFAQRYGHPSWNLFAPAVHDLRNCPANGSAAAEFPLLYYVDALFREATGASVSLLRLIHLLFVLAGHILLAGLAGRWLGSMIAGTAFSLWMFSSSIVIYYGANFLPDAAVYGCVLLGGCLAVQAWMTDRRLLSPVAVGLLAFAGLLKAPASFYLLAYMMSTFYLARKGTGACRSHPHGWMVAWTGIAVIIAWHAYAIRANAAHHTWYFMTWAEPIWDMGGKDIMMTWDLIVRYWWTKYHHPSTWHTLLVLLLVLLWRVRRLPVEGRTVLFLLTGASLAFMALFFPKLRDHDYYFLTLAPVVIALALTSLVCLRQVVQRKWTTPALTVVLIILAIMGMELGRKNLERRYAPHAERFAQALALGYDMPLRLDSLRIPRTARFIVVGDPTPNGALSLLDRDGWAFADTERVAVPTLVALGADHVLFIGDDAWADTTGASTVLTRPGLRLMRLFHDGSEEMR